MSLETDYIKSVCFEFDRYKSMGEKTFAQLTDEEIHWKYTDTDNSIAIIVKHMVGNMLSRWTNFLTEDGEKTWRNREMEFEAPYTSKSEMLVAWKRGWDCLFEALDGINKSNFNTKVKIRNQEHSIIEAVNRQLAHYSSHVGQLVFLGKMIKGKDWTSLSIPKGGSEAFNRKMFS
ncbi:MAG: DUF1572 family protein [Bacteroidota bacterium]